MVAYGFPILYALFVWWFSTGVVMYLDGLPPATFRWSMAGGTIVFAAATYGAFASRNDLSVSGAYCGFTCGLLAWAWQELSFYTGLVTGPRRTSCSEGCSGWPHFVHAVQACLYHELAIIFSAGILLAASWGGGNFVAFWTFVLLWAMHTSARLNVFLGVRNVSAEFLPPHLEHLKSFLRQGSMNLLFPVSVTISTIAAALLVQRAAGAPGPFEKAGFTYIATLLVAAILEHWFLMLPLPVARLWEWALASRKGRASNTRQPGWRERQPLVAAARG